MPKSSNLIGQKFGRLTILDKTDQRKDGNICWLCQCDCGNQLLVPTRHLKRGNTKSCGCLHKEIVGKQFSKNIAQQRFGKLIALQPTQMRSTKGTVMWLCQCDCGNTKLVPTDYLLSGTTQSCGCIHSRGNAKINLLLSQASLPYATEYCVRIDNINYFYDFVIFNEQNQIQCFIEYDGILHYQQDKYHGWNNQDNWTKVQKNDKIKTQWCKENNIKLIRIPYTNFDLLTLDDLERLIKNG